MRIRSLYLSIYLTVLAVLLVFALVAGALVHQHSGAERERMDRMHEERAVVWAALIEKSLPAASAPESAQRDEFQQWAHRLRLSVALETSDGRRIATAERFTEDQRSGARTTRVALEDGRVLLAVPPGPPRPPPWGRIGGPPRPWMPFWFEGGPSVLALLAVLFMAIALGSYPVVRRLTHRLEALKGGVEAFGAGDLGHRVPADGGDEVAAVAASFNRAAERIESLVRANRSLLANASHELRSPLARMKMALAMLDSAGADQRGALSQELHQDIAELDALVEEVLLASRLDAQAPMAADPVDMLALAAEEAARTGAEVDLTGVGDDLAATRVRGDERLLRRALRNLLENARRYGGSNVVVLLSRQDDRLRCSVCDRGPGIPDAFRERIFEPFFRLPGHAEQAGGVGLGLSLVRQIAHAHGGEAHCEQRDGGGSCFVLTLPGTVPS